MARKRSSPETIGEILARLMDVKRRMIEAGIASGDLGPAREVIDGVRIFVRYLMLRRVNNLLLRGPLGIPSAHTRPVCCGCVSHPPRSVYCAHGTRA